MRDGPESTTQSPPLSRAGEGPSPDEARNRLRDRLGLNVPYEWWPRAATLKAIEAAGFGWVQVASPPVEMLASPPHLVRHARAVRRSLETTALRVIVHGPTDLRLGPSQHNRAFEGLLEYAHQLDATQVVYHALDMAKPGTESEREEHALRRMARWAESLGVVVALENLCPVYPGAVRVCHDPLAVRDLVLRCDSPAVRMLFDVGHAHVVADREGTDVVAFVESVLDVVSLFHVHDNFGARRREPENVAVDPLRLDLHLPPGEGTLPWARARSGLLRSEAPLMLEVHPSSRPRAATLYELSEGVLVEPARAAGPTPELFPNALV